MIDPTKITNYSRTRDELEEFLLFSIIVAGKGAFQQASKLEQFLSAGMAVQHPFGHVRALDCYGKLEEALKEVKMGQYHRISTAFRGVAHFLGGNEHILELVDVKLLEAIKGIGMKTARFFIMHSRPNQQLACLDTHILQWLGERGHEVPKQTPNGKKYLELEKIFLDYCRQAGKSPADMDLDIWNSKHPKNS